MLSSLKKLSKLINYFKQVCMVMCNSKMLSEVLRNLIWTMMRRRLLKKLFGRPCRINPVECKWNNWLEQN